MSEGKGKRTRLVSVGREAAYLALGVALLAVCAYIAVPIGGIPVTMQTFAVALVGALYGVRRGTAAVAVYFLMGLIGIPVFAGFRSGVSALVGATGGYLFGFLFDAFIVGLFALIPVKNSFGKMAVVFGGMALGLFVCYAFGTAWFVTVFHRGSATGVSVAEALTLCVVPYLLPDLIKIALAALLSTKIKSPFKR